MYKCKSLASVQIQVPKLVGEWFVTLASGRWCRVNRPYFAKTFENVSENPPDIELFFKTRGSLSTQITCIKHTHIAIVLWQFLTQAAENNILKKPFNNESIAYHNIIVYGVARFQKSVGRHPDLNQTH
jgi:hypothetical protein